MTLTVDNVATKKTLVAIPANMLRRVDGIAIVESRTRSDLIREAIRRYIIAYDRECAVRQVVVVPSHLEPKPEFVE